MMQCWQALRCFAGSMLFGTGMHLASNTVPDLVTVVTPPPPCTAGNTDINNTNTTSCNNLASYSSLLVP